MTDPSLILDGLFDGLGPAVAGDFPPLPTSLPTSHDRQNIEVTSFSHISHASHCENGRSEKTSSVPADATDFLASRSRVTSFYVESVGRVGSVGNDPDPPLQNTSSFFPLSSEKVGRVGREDASAGQPLPISSSDVRAGVERELRTLTGLGRTGPDALREAIEITEAKIRNSAALAERQATDGRCHVCAEPLDDSRPEIAVMQGRPGKPLHMHAGCHAEHKARRSALVEATMQSAGYGTPATSETCPARPGCPDPNHMKGS